MLPTSGRVILFVPFSFILTLASNLSFRPLDTRFTSFPRDLRVRARARNIRSCLAPPGAHFINAKLELMGAENGDRPRPDKTANTSFGCFNFAAETPYILQERSFTLERARTARFLLIRSDRFKKFPSNVPFASRPALT